jgi:hypothetical protein
MKIFPWKYDIKKEYLHVLVKRAGHEIVGQAVLDLISRGKLKPSTLYSYNRSPLVSTKLIERAVSIVKKGERQGLHGNVVVIA